MLINNTEFTALWEGESTSSPDSLKSISVIDQRVLPHQFKIIELTSSIAIIDAISYMLVRGAPLIGVAAAYAVYFALKESIAVGDNEYFEEAVQGILLTRPTAVNLKWAVDLVLGRINLQTSNPDKLYAAISTARKIREFEINNCKRIGEIGVSIIKDIYDRTQKPVNVLTHCNAGWLATVDYGTALSPVYKAAELGIPIHVWVGETRPRNQGASLTAWELLQNKIPHTLIADNAGGLLMMQNKVDLVIVGADRVASNADTANKIGTYLKSLAAYEHSVPFYVAMPSSSYDSSIATGESIDIEDRSQDEIKYIQGLDKGMIRKVLICPEETSAYNPGFDITPAKFITGFITEQGIYSPSTISELEPIDLEQYF